MIVVANRFFVNPEFAGQFEERFRTRSGLVDGMPGFVANHVLKPTEPNHPYVVLTFWRSKEDFEAWVASPQFREGHARSSTQPLPSGTYTAKNEIEIHEVLTSTVYDAALKV